MAVLYFALLLVLALVQLLLRWRVGRLEKRYVRVASEADGLLKQASFRPGNSNRLDPLVSARQQFNLAVMAMRRDRIEERYSAWQAFAERFGQFRGQLLSYRGQVLPYVSGLLDLTLAVLVLDWFGLGVRNLIAFIL